MVHIPPQDKEKAILYTVCNKKIRGFQKITDFFRKSIDKTVITVYTVYVQLKGGYDDRTD